MPEEDSILTLIGEQGRALLKEEVAILQNLKELASCVSEDSKESTSVLDNLLSHIEELFLLVIVGEVKAGKSSFVNALFGRKICKEGVTPVTDKIHILRYGEEDEIKELEPYILEHRYPFDPLKNLNVVDTPGTNSLILEHQKITERFIPRADLVLFTTSIDRPFTESERQLLEYIKDSWGKKIIFVLTKIDIKQPKEVTEVTAFIQENANKLLSFDPLIFPVSGKSAFESKQNGDKKVWEESRFEEIENYIFKVLSNTERLKLKLSGPLFTAVKIIDKLSVEVGKRRQIIELDTDVIGEIDKVLSYEERMMKQNYATEVDKVQMVLRDLERWGRNFFDENIKLSNLKLLLKKETRTVFMDKDRLLPVPRLIEQTMEKALERLFGETRGLWNQTFESLQKKFKTSVCVRQYTPEERSRIDAVDSGHLVRDMQEVVKHQLQTIDVPEECKAILLKTYMMLLYFGGAVAGVVLLGLLLNLFASSWLVNLIGIFMILGSLFVLFKFIPRQKNIAVQNLIARVNKLGEELKWQMERFYQKEYDAVVSLLRQSLKKREELLSTERSTNDIQKSDLDRMKSRLVAMQEQLRNLSDAEPLLNASALHGKLSSETSSETVQERPTENETEQGKTSENREEAPPLFEDD